MSDHNKAREMWAALAHDKRKEILAALEAPAHLFNHDWAGLPPEVHAGIVAGMPVEPAAEEAPRRRPRKDDD